MVFLNGKFIAKNQAFVPVMDRGFLFGDGVYEVIPVYNRKLFRLDAHLNRLQESLNSVAIKSPYNVNEWLEIINQIVSYSEHDNQSIYLQITRGSGTKRAHTYNELNPNIYIESNPLHPRSQKEASEGFSAITREDIRWGRCDIKSTSLLANILYTQQAKQHGAEEAILIKNNKVTEGATSNVFLITGDTLYTHPTGTEILSGITRDLILESANSCDIIIKENAFTIDDMLSGDEVWISSSTREVIPITKVDHNLINNGEVGEHWKRVYKHYHKLTN